MRKGVKHLILTQLFLTVLIVITGLFFYSQFRGLDDFELLIFQKNNSNPSTYYVHNSTYPLIMVHGHSSQESLLVKNSLKAFYMYQEKLERDGLYEGYGIVYPGEINTPELKGAWANTTSPISVRTTYYIDLEEGKINRSQALALAGERNISESAIRLSNVIDTVIYRTNAEKTDIISHSMGGLVVREYLRIYGDKKIGKIIMIATPNKGVSGLLTTRLCNFANPSIECLQMRADSGFLKELNQLNMTYYNTSTMTIAGSCCRFCALCNGQDLSDQVVFVKNVGLDGAKNLVFNSSKGQVEELHSELINPYIHYDVYIEVTNFLKQK